MSVRQEIPVLARLATPVVLGNIGMMLMNVVDTYMVSGLGGDALAATFIGNIWLIGTVFPIAGILFGMDPIVTQAHGAREGWKCGLALQRALVLCVPLSLVVIAAWLLTERVLLLARQDPGLAHVAQQFAGVQAWSVSPMLVMWALRQYLSGRGIMKPAMWVSIGANAVNLVGNWALIYGHLGFEPHGVLGSGIATSVSRTAMALGLIAWVLVRKLHVGAWSAWSREALSRSGMAELLRHGLPAGGQMALEIWGFSATGLMAGWISRPAVAAHALALNLASLSFMMPMGIAAAAATRVGNLTGAGDEREARVAARTALVLGAGVMTLSALAFVLGRRWLPALFGVDEGVVALAASILPIAAAFQVFDGTQVVGCGVLRGRGDTQPAFWFNLVGYYALGLPLSALLAFRLGLGLPGLWWGLVLGLAAVAVMLVARILRRH